jgi:hypothetical protein
LSQSMRKSCLPLSGISCNFWDGLFLMTPNPHQDNLLLALWVGEWIRIFIKGRTLGKTYYGIKARVLLGTPLGNLLGTYWELIGNLNGTKEKWKKNILECMLRSLTSFACCMKFLFPKLFVIIFGLG